MGLNEHYLRNAETTLFMFILEIVVLIHNVLFNTSILRSHKIAPSRSLVASELATTGSDKTIYLIFRIASSLEFNKLH